MERICTVQDDFLQIGAVLRAGIHCAVSCNGGNERGGMDKHDPGRILPRLTDDPTRPRRKEKSCPVVIKDQDPYRLWPVFYEKNQTCFDYPVW